MDGDLLPSQVEPLHKRLRVHIFTTLYSTLTLGCNPKSNIGKGENDLGAPDQLIALVGAAAGHEAQLPLQVHPRNQHKIISNDMMFL